MKNEKKPKFVRDEDKGKADLLTRRKEILRDAKERIDEGGPTSKVLYPVLVREICDVLFCGGDECVAAEFRGMPGESAVLAKAVIKALRDLGIVK